jgi:hypothetical protein
MMSDSEPPASLDIHPAAVESEPVKSGSPAHKDDEDEVTFKICSWSSNKKTPTLSLKFKLTMIMPIQ